MATTATLNLRVGGFGYTNFYFANSVPLVPGTTYYLQPIAATGNPATQIGIPFYANGTIFENGNAVINDNLWFREGIVVPEPSAIALSGLAFAALVGKRRRGDRHVF